MNPLYAERLTEQAPASSEGGTNYYNGSEVELLIDDLSAIAKEAIEQAGAEAAKAAALASIERQAELLQEKAAAMREAAYWQREAEAEKATGVKNTIIAGAVFLLGGLAAGAGGVLFLRN